MFVIDCAACRGRTLVTDPGGPGVCRWCGRLQPASGRVTDHPDAVRRFLLDELRPVADLLLTFGIGQLLTAGLYIFVFILGNGAYLIGRFDHAPMLYAIGLALLVGGILIIAASVAVRGGGNRLIAVTGAWFALTSPLLIGLPLGAWAVWKLTRPEVRAAFARSRPDPTDA